MRSIIAIAIALLAMTLTACVAVDDTDPADDVTAVVLPDPRSPDPRNAPNQPLPLQIGEFCLLTGCDAEHWNEPNGGDDQCEAATGNLGVSCCLADTTCGRGVRFHGPCLGFNSPPPIGEQCPNDDNGDGLCSYAERWYSLCE